MARSGAFSLPGFLGALQARSPGETEFHQAVQEVVRPLLPLLASQPALREQRILERLTEPDRIIGFRICWEDDAGHVQVNRGWRVQHCNALGPYKGGLRFHPSVTPSVLKFLAFEQTFKNALTGLPLGGAKGGSDFDPHGRSAREVMRFCQAFMTALQHDVGDDLDVPAGDIGVGGREIGFLFGQWKRLTRRHSGVLTGKGVGWGGSPGRTEATGHGCVLFMQEMLARRGLALAGLTCTVSGAGNVAQHTAQRLIAEGARVVTLSDSDGFIHDPAGLDAERLAFVMALKNERHGRIAEYARHFRGARFHAKRRPWGVPCDLAFPCATQNELDEHDARTLVSQGCRAVAEGANMPSTPGAIAVLRAAHLPFAPGKAANAGGVAVSGLEMSQNSTHLVWPAATVERQLGEIMHDIHARCAEFGAGRHGIDYVKGANLAGFTRVANALLAYGVH